MDAHKAFVHVLVFQCPKSGDPICELTLRPERSLEESHVVPFNVKCSCGWQGQMLGVNARMHWVEAWSNGKSSTS